MTKEILCTESAGGKREVRPGGYQEVAGLEACRYLLEVALCSGFLIGAWLTNATEAIACSLMRVILKGSN